MNNPSTISTAVTTGFLKADGSVPMTGNLDIAGFAIKMNERTTPTTPSADQVLMYARDNGSGKTQFVLMGSDGTPGPVWTLT